MSNVTNVLQRNVNDSTSMVFYNSNSVDSIFGAGLIKYICENITDVSEDCECIDIKDFDINDLYTSYTSYALSYTTPTYINVSFIDCAPAQEDMITLSYVYSDTCLYVTDNKKDFTNIKNVVKNNSTIEYNESDSCALNLYKIAFGEFEDTVPDVVKQISNFKLKQFDKDYEEGLRFNYGFKQNYVSFADFYENILEKVIVEENSEEVNENSITDTIAAILDDGDAIVKEDINSIKRNSQVALNDLWKVGNKDTVVLFTNGPISEDILDELEIDRLIVFYRNDKDNWSLEFFVKELSVEKVEELENRKAELLEQDSLTTNDKKELNEINNKLNFNCGEYLKNNFKGLGNKNHGYALISNDRFLKLNASKRF